MRIHSNSHSVRTELMILDSHLFIVIAVKTSIYGYFSGLTGRTGATGLMISSEVYHAGLMILDSHLSQEIAFRQALDS